jgi:putative MATE family efflux protein
LSKSRDLTSGSIRQHLIQLTIPMIFGLLSLVAFNLIDNYFVGQLGEDQLSSLSLTLPVIIINFILIKGIGIGATALISRSIGKNDREKAARETTDSLFLAVALAGIFVVAGQLTIKPTFRMLGASEEVLPYIVEYMQPWYWAILFVVIPFVGNSAIRATGDALTPSLIMFFAVVINAILDPLLIFGYGPFPALGIGGAAYATAISRGMTMVLSLHVLNNREKLITRHIPSFEVLKGCWKSILYIGLPSGISRMITPLAVGVATKLLAQHSAAAVAAFGVGTRLEFLVSSVLIALSASIGPIVGQNLGKNNFKRISSAVKESTWFAILWGFILSVMLAIVAKPLGALFTDSQEVVEYLSLYLYIVPFSFGFQGVVLIINSSLNTLNKPIDASLLVLAQNFFIYIPGSYAGSELLGVSGILGAIALAYVVGGIISVYWHRRTIDNLQKHVHVE